MMQRLTQPWMSQGFASGLRVSHNRLKALFPACFLWPLGAEELPYEGRFLRHLA